MAPVQWSTVRSLHCGDRHKSRHRDGGRACERRCVGHRCQVRLPDVESKSAAGGNGRMVRIVRQWSRRRSRDRALAEGRPTERDRRRRVARRASGWNGHPIVVVRAVRRRAIGRRAKRPRRVDLAEIAIRRRVSQRQAQRCRHADSRKARPCKAPGRMDVCKAPARPRSAFPYRPAGDRPAR